MAANEVHLNDVGTLFKFTVMDGSSVVDISTATCTMYFHKPDGTELEKSASLFTDGTDGILTYTTVSGDIDQVGKWKVQALIDFGDSEFYSDVHSLTVYRNLC